MGKLITLLLGLIITLNTFSQENLTISGRVKDESGEELAGASVYLKRLKIGTITNAYGFYSITLPKGEYSLSYEYIGYNPVNKRIILNENLVVNIVLKERVVNIEEVIISAKNKNENVEQAQMSNMKLQSKEIKRIPAFMGEVDVIKAIQLMPGVQASSEGTSGFNVRGGGADQNLILLDEATVYNASHLMGFFSVFNNDAIKDINLYKGDIPVAFGGRLSSLLDIRMKEGGNNKIKAYGGIGTITSRLTVEGPIKSEKSSFLLSGRRSYADLMLRFANDEEVRKNKLYFYDFNMKTNYKIDDNDRFYLSGYLGRDVFNFEDALGFNWGNTTITGRWNHLFSEKLFSNLSINVSNYNYEIFQDDNSLAFNWESSLLDISMKYDFTYYLNTKNTIQYGVLGTFHHFNPGIASASSEDQNYDDIKVPKSNALEWAGYFSNQWKPNNRTTLNIGIRVSAFQNMGSATAYKFDENYESIDSTTYKNGDVYHTYYGFEPRANIKFRVNGTSSIKASYARTIQYIHLASNSTAGSPLDVWMPSSPNIKPQKGNQYAIGYFRNLNDNAFETSIEIYYKDMHNQIDFRDHANLLLNPEIEGEFRFGDAEAYGLELLLRKQTGKFTGWISYTLSKATRKIAEINNGERYPASYDKPHSVSIVTNYDFNRKWNVALNWTYATGSAVTFPVGRFIYDDAILPIYSKRNAYRMPDYHRMDLSVNYKFGKRIKNNYRNELNLSIYNLYNRKNAWMINFRADDDLPDVSIAEKVYLFPILPSITYNFYF